MNKLLIIFIVLLAVGCKEKFDAPVPDVVTGYLVIEGVINNEGGQTNISLSRTTNIGSIRKIAEKGAMVKLEDNNNVSLPLFETNEGNYTIDNLHLDTTRRYRLSINTINNEQYLSDFEAVRYNPPIDSVNWVRENNGVQLYINTHDPKNNTRYYQWQYDETWEFHSAYVPELKYIKGTPPNNADIGVTSRVVGDPSITICWQFEASTALLLGSSAKLTQDIIYLPLAQIPAASWKASVLYSILVKQYAWSKQGFEFLERMKKNTENLGSVFDAQPSELNTNFTCITNPTQPVIGFFNICTIQEKRIFIKNSQLPGWNYRSGCEDIVIENNPDSILIKGFGKLPTTVAELSPFGGIISFHASDAPCVDCTLKGTNIKPLYWP